MLKEKENKDELLNTLQGMEHELKGIKRKSFKQIVHILLAVLISLINGLTGGIICGQNWDSILLKIRPDRYSDTTVSEIEEKLQKQAELNTGLYQQTSSYDSGDLYNNELAEKLKINSKSMQFTYTGYVEAGIKNLEDAKVNIDPKNKSISIEHIKIEITNVYIDPSSITDAKSSKNIFNQLTIKDFVESQKELEEKLINDAKEEGIIEAAQTNAEATLINIFGDTISEYRVDFKWE